MDTLDERLVTLLRHDARRTVSDLAVDLGVSRATVRSRMERLEKAGEIIGYTVVLRADAVDQRMRGVMMIEIEGHAADRVIRALGGFPEVSTIHTTNGRWDLIAELDVETLADFSAALDRIRQLEGIASTETSILLATHKF